MKIKFNKEGLEGEELKAIEKLEKNVTIEGALTAEKVAELISTGIKEAAISKSEFEAVKKHLDKDNPESVFMALESINQRFDILDQKHSERETRVKSFNEELSHFIDGNIEEIRKAADKQGKTKLEGLKAGDMSISANFSNSTPFLTEARGLVTEPYNRVYVSDIISQGTTNKPWITFPKENGGDGGAAIWVDHTNPKSQMDFDLTGSTVFVHWNAGFVIIEREFLDDVDFLKAWLNNKMLLSLKNGRENFVMNGITVASDPAKSVDGLLDVATNHVLSSGLLDNPVNRVVDSGYGQIISDTHGEYSPTHTILHPRRAVSIGLNQADGSKEYDLPAGSVGFVNGKLNIGGIQVVNYTGTNWTEDDYLTIDRRAAMLITKMQPSLEVFVDATLAKYNKVMLRIEERITLLTFNDKAIVKGTFGTPTT